MAFKTIETQEELDNIIGERLKRERETTASKYADYEELKSKIEKLQLENSSLQESMKSTEEEKFKAQTAITQLESDLKGYEISNLKTKIALQMGIPFDMACRLMGDEYCRED